MLPPVTQQVAPLQQKASSPTLANFSPSSLFTTLSWAESTCQQQRASRDDLGGQHWAAPTPPAPSCPHAPKHGQPGAAGARHKAPLAPLCSGLWALLNAFKGPDSLLLPFCHSPRVFLGTTSHGQAHPTCASRGCWRSPLQACPRGLMPRCHTHLHRPGKAEGKAVCSQQQGEAAVLRCSCSKGKPGLSGDLQDGHKRLLLPPAP